MEVVGFFIINDGLLIGETNVASEKEITSTEKLLDVIRGGSDPAQGRKELFPGKRRFLFWRSVRQKGISVGIYIDSSMIRLVKVTPDSYKSWRLIDYASVPIPADLARGKPGFTALLKDTLSRYCDNSDNMNLWAMLPEIDVEVRNISVPRAARKELKNVILWSAKKEFAFDEQKTVFDFEIQGEIVESGVEKLGILFYAAPRKEVDEIKELFNASGFPLSGLTVAPLALQNIFRTGWIPAQKRTIASLYIGHGSSRIDILSEGNLVMTREIKAGLNSMAESLVDEYAKWRKLSGGSGIRTEISSHRESVVELADTAAAPESITLEQAVQLVLALGSDSESNAGLESGKFGLDDEKVFQMITPALERLIRQVERTFEHHEVNMGRERIGAIYLSTAMNACQPMVNYVGAQLGIESDFLDPLDPDHARVQGVISVEKRSERMAFVPALGVALSHGSRALNLIYTQEDRDKRKRYIAVNAAAAAIICMFIVAGMGWYLWLDNTIERKSARVALIEERLAVHERVSETALLKMASDLRLKQQAVAETRKRYFAAAVLSEVSAITPDRIKLTKVSADLGKIITGGPAAATRPPGTMLIEGVVTGGKDSLEADLIAYVMSLQKSLFFDRVVINAKNSQPMEGQEVLRFSLSASSNGAFR
ncbi:MAG: pilus assembly protein PilM [Syntrophales bacterium]|nr:pilus assembly protein PilM [Syntrophales bacterium]